MAHEPPSLSFWDWLMHQRDQVSERAWKVKRPSAVAKLAQALALEDRFRRRVFSGMPYSTTRERPSRSSRLEDWERYVSGSSSLRDRLPVLRHAFQEWVAATSPRLEDDDLDDDVEVVFVRRRKARA